MAQNKKNNEDKVVGRAEVQLVPEVQYRVKSISTTPERLAADLRKEQARRVGNEMAKEIRQKVDATNMDPQQLIEELNQKTPRRMVSRPSYEPKSKVLYGRRFDPIRSVDVWDVELNPETLDDKIDEALTQIAETQDEKARLEHRLTQIDRELREGANWLETLLSVNPYAGSYSVLRELRKKSKL